MHLLKFWCIKLWNPSLGTLHSPGYSDTFLLCHIFFLLVLTGGRGFMSPVVLPGTHHTQKLVEAAPLLQLLGRRCSSAFEQEWGAPHPLFRE